MVFFKSKKISSIKHKILEKEEPSNMEEAEIYEKVIESHSSPRPIYAWGSYLLLQYYRNSAKGDKAILSKSVRYGEQVRDDFKEYSFYEDALFILGNIYFFEIFDFKMASRVYSQLIKERRNTRWKSICVDRVNLIESSEYEEEELKLYVHAEKNFEESKFEDAEFYLNEIINKKTKSEINTAALYFMGDIYYYKYNDLRSAEKYYRMTAENFPDHSLAPTSLYKVGEILRKMQKWEEATAVYREYVAKFKISPYKDDAYYYLGESCLNLGKLREAKNYFNLILGDYPNSKWTDVIYHKVQDINKVLRAL